MAPDHTTEHREARLALGVEASLIPPAEVALPATPAGAIRVMQWNILADGLSLDGFLVQDILEANGDPELKDTSAEGRRAALRASADAVAHARASGDQAGLEALQQQLGTERQRRNLLATVDWRCRWALIRAKITAAAPHIICLEELDHFADAKADLGALGYVCGPPEAQYVPAHSVPGCNSKRTADSYDPAAYLTHLERVGLAFAPKVPSTCRELHMKRVGNEEVDDDGVAIFWRADSFHLIGVDFFSHADKTRSQGAVRVKLRRSAGAETLSVMCSHLPSGASEKDMAERRAVLHGPSSTKASATEHAGPSLCEWYAQAASEGTAIWCMDSNAAPNHASGAPTWMAVMESCNSNGGESLPSYYPLLSALSTPRRTQPRAHTTLLLLRASLHPSSRPNCLRAPPGRSHARRTLRLSMTRRGGFRLGAIL